MLSRPDTWRFSIDGLLRFITEKKSALQSGLEELEKFGYLKRIKKHINGRISYYYEIHETPTAEQNSKPEKNAPAKKQHSEKQSAENQRQKNSVQKTASHSNIDDTHTETNNTDLQRKKSESKRTQATSLSKPKRKFGSYQNVPLTDEEYQNLCDCYGTEETDRSIESMSKYMAVNDKKYAKNLFS